MSDKPLRGIVCSTDRAELRALLTYLGWPGKEPEPARRQKRLTPAEGVDHEANDRGLRRLSWALRLACAALMAVSLWVTLTAWAFLVRG